MGRISTSHRAGVSLCARELGFLVNVTDEIFQCRDAHTSANAYL